jgi:hypothetical protein
VQDHGQADNSEGYRSESVVDQRGRLVQLVSSQTAGPSLEDLAVPALAPAQAQAFAPAGVVVCMVVGVVVRIGALRVIRQEQAMMPSWQVCWKPS